VDTSRPSARYVSTNVPAGNVAAGPVQDHSVKPTHVCEAPNDPTRAVWGPAKRVFHTPSGQAVLTSLLAFQAMLPAWRSQQVRHRPVVDVIHDLLGSTWLPRELNLAIASGAARKALSVLARFGGLDSCLTRALVLGALVSDQDDVVLHLGFRPSTQLRAPIDGHAWLTVQNRNVSDDTALLCGNPYTIATSIVMRRCNKFPN
jgi:hypothetical protein